jgi:hypothetical protein
MQGQILGSAPPIIHDGPVVSGSFISGDLRAGNAVFGISANTDGGNNTAGQRADRKSRRILGSRRVPTAPKSRLRILGAHEMKQLSLPVE